MEDREVFTGLLSANGDLIYRVLDPVGFGLPHRG
jgi:hypothetical protein